MAAGTAAQVPHGTPARAEALLTSPESAGLPESIHREALPVAPRTIRDIPLPIIPEQTETIPATDTSPLR